MIRLNMRQIMEKFPTLNEAALISLKAKGYRYIIWNEEKDIDPLLAKTFDTMISAAKDFGKGAAAADIIWEAE